MSPVIYVAAALLLASCVSSNNSTISSDGDTTCAAEQEGPFTCLLEDWVTAETVHQGRHGRIMALPPTQGYYVSERIDLVPPPPPHHHPPHMHHRGPYPMAGHHQSGPQHGPPPSGPYHGPPPPGAHHGPPPSPPHHGPGPHSQPPGPQEPNARLEKQPAPPQSTGSPADPLLYDEWQATPPPPPGSGKILNRPPNPYKDQFKPSYPPPSPNQHIPVHGLSDRADEARPPPPNKQVSETDLYLLGAIEKLVYRVDLMEKRLRKMEENLHYIVAGTETKPEPCPDNFTRVGGGCYHFSSEALNWKSANYACRKLKANLLEFDDEEKRQFTSGVLADKKLKGFDLWTGGLNPGLLWIWAHSAKPVANNTDSSASTVVGEGRCLAFVHDPAVNNYVYRGQDCGLRHKYVCERDEDKTKIGNEIERVARKLREKKRKPKIMWSDEES